MASVWKHPSSPFWTGIYRDEKGKWRRYATKQRLRSKALVLAQDLEDLAAQAREQNLSEQAFIKESDRMRRRRFGDRNLRTVRDFFSTWSAGKTLAKAEGTAIRYAATAGRFILFLGERADQPLASVEPSDCQAFYDDLLRQKLAPATRVVEMKTVMTIFNAGVRQRLLPFNPAAAIELPQKIKQVQRKTFTPAQVEIILREAGPGSEWYTVIMFGYYAGPRLGDCKTLRWENVDLLNHRLSYRPHKTGDELILPLHEKLEQYLNEIAGDAGGPICPGLAAQPVGGRNGLSQQFLSLMRRAGISQESVSSGGQRKLATLSFHSLRKTFNSQLHNEGVSQEVRKKLTGHKSDTVNDRYTQTEDRTLREAVKRLPKLERLNTKQAELFPDYAPSKKPSRNVAA